jgi:phosphatidate cytidylyltransferase
MSKELFKRTITSVILISCLGGAYLHSTTLYSALLIALDLMIFNFELPNLFPINSLKRFALGIIYPGISIVCLILLNEVYRVENMILPLYPFFIAWSADTCGYFVGKAIGRHKMCPTISPGKSWEGFGGSILGVLAVHIFLSPVLINTPFSLSIGWVKIALLTVIMTTIAFLGGLMLSFLKRKQGLKDAGNVLPGHGGFLDRFDSVFFVAPATWLTLLLAQFLST